MLSLQNIWVEVELAYRKKYDYLGVEMEFNEDRTLSVSMITYLKNVIAGFPEEIRAKASSPAADHGGKGDGGGKSSCSPPYRGTVTVHVYQSKTRYADCSGFSNDESKSD